MVGQSSPVTFATTKLSYPIFDAEFDPYNRGYLVVAGGGGENRTGVANKITLLDVSSRSAVSEVTEISLSTDEDSPQSIASLTTKKGLITFAGISSSIADQKAGKNEHFRSYDIEFPPKKRVKRDKDAAATEEKGSEGRITLAGKSSLFKPPTLAKCKAYQRLLRLSPIKSRDISTKRIGAIAAADAVENEIIVFDATTFMPNSSSILARIDTGVEAEDLDLYERSEGSFALAYCTNHDAFVRTITCDFTSKTSDVSSNPPEKLYSTPVYGARRPKLRSFRWVGPDHLFLLQNSSPGGGSEILVMRTDNGEKSIIQRHRIPNSIGVAIRLDVCCLDADPVTGKRQIVAAVAGQDKTIHIFTCNHEPKQSDPARKISKLRSFSVVDTSRQHPQSISKISFGNFFPPAQSDTSNMSVESESQYIQLVSVSLGYTVSVETLELTTVTTSPSSTPDAPTKQKSPSVRWVLSTRRSEFLQSWHGIALIGFVVLVTGVLLQYYISHILQSDRVAQWRDLMEAHQVTEVLAGDGIGTASGNSNADVVDITSQRSVASDSASLQDLVQQHPEHLETDQGEGGGSEGPRKVIHITPNSENADANDVSASVHEDVESLRAQGAKRFDELENHEKEAWKKKLTAAGQWSAEEGETVLKGIFFSGWADIVGGAIRDAIL